MTHRSALGASPERGTRPSKVRGIAALAVPAALAVALIVGVAAPAQADARVDELRLQATACRWAQLNGETCRTVPSTWTAPTPTPSPTPSASASATPSTGPTTGLTPGPTPRIALTVQPTVPPAAVPTGGPVTS